MPLGHGFAGCIAANREPVGLNRVDNTTVLNPILWTNGIRSKVGVPMVAGGDVIGVLHVGSRAPGQFTGDDGQLRARRHSPRGPTPPASGRRSGLSARVTGQGSASS